MHPRDTRLVSACHSRVCVMCVCVCVCVCVCSERRAGRLHVQGGLHRSDVSELQPRDIQGSTGPGIVQFACQRLGSYSYEPFPRTFSTLYMYVCVHVHVIHTYIHTCMHKYIHTYVRMCMYIRTARTRTYTHILIHTHKHTHRNLLHHVGSHLGGCMRELPGKLGRCCLQRLCQCLPLQRWLFWCVV